MPNPQVKIKFVHPFIRYEREFEVTEPDTKLSDLMKTVLEETKAYGRFAKSGGRRVDRLDGCVVMREGDQIGYIDKTGYVAVDESDEEIHDYDEIIIMIPITGG